MDRRAVKGDLAGYDGDQWYKIFMKEDHCVILARDIIFQQKASQSDDHTEFSLDDREESHP